MPATDLMGELDVHDPSLWISDCARQTARPGSGSVKFNGAPTAGRRCVASFIGRPGMNFIGVRRMADAGGRSCNCPVRLSRPDLAWERNGFLVNDGPALLTKKGRVSISYSAGASDAHRCMGLLWADASADLLVHRARDHLNIVGDPLNDPNRHACVQPFGGRTDGLPDLGGPVADGLFFEASST